VTSERGRDLALAFPLAAMRAVSCPGSRAFSGNGSVSVVLPAFSCRVDGELPAVRVAERQVEVGGVGERDRECERSSGLVNAGCVYFASRMSGGIRPGWSTRRPAYSRGSTPLRLRECCSNQE